jgi:hypothetical protein
MRLIVSATTPGETKLCRGMFAECWPHGQAHLVCGPSSETFSQPCRFSALVTSRCLIAFATTVCLDPLDSQCQGGLDSMTPPAAVTLEAGGAGEPSHRTDRRPGVAQLPEERPVLGLCLDGAPTQHWPRLVSPGAVRVPSTGAQLRSHPPNATIYVRREAPANLMSPGRRAAGVAWFVA